jgi:hypothetical protein
MPAKLKWGLEQPPHSGCARPKVYLKQSNGMEGNECSTGNAGSSVLAEVLRQPSCPRVPGLSLPAFCRFPCRLTGVPIFEDSTSPSQQLSTAPTVVAVV